MSRVKRTYSLPARTIQLVKELAADYRLAPTQDAVIELAVDELARRELDRREAEAWAAAADDPEFRAETGALEQGFRTADLETWPPE